MKRFYFSSVMYSTVMAIGGLIGVSNVNAQTTESYSAYNRNYYVAPSPVWNYPRFGYDSWGSHASTYEAGVLAGMGSLYRGVGEYNVANSVAAYNWQLARNANLMNNIAERQARANMYASVRIAQERRHQENMKKNQAVAAYHAKSLENRFQLSSSRNRKSCKLIPYELLLRTVPTYAYDGIC